MSMLQAKLAEASLRVDGYQNAATLNFHYVHNTLAVSYQPAAGFLPSVGAVFSAQEYPRGSRLDQGKVQFMAPNAGKNCCWKRPQGGKCHYLPEGIKATRRSRPADTREGPRPNRRKQDGKSPSKTQSWLDLPANDFSSEV